MPHAGPAGIERLLSARIADGCFPGASYLVAADDRVLAAGALGHAVIAPEAIPATADTLYDLASLTKPLVTALLAVRLQAAGRLRLDDPLPRHLPQWAARDDGAGAITLLDLLTHRSGLPPWRPLYLYASDRDGRIAWLASHALTGPPGAEVAYSCPGYILAGFALERAGGAPLRTLFEDWVTSPLRIDDLIFKPPRGARRRIAATETGNVRERSLAGPEGERYNGWREDLIWGEVHDNNAHTLGGVAGNAGLFGTVQAVHSLARQFLDGRGDFLREADLHLFRENATPGRAEDRTVGFQLASTTDCSAGPSLAPGSFGHTGFTGTSLWIDPVARRIYVLLTNRVHPRFREVDMNSIRREFHTLAAGL